MSSSPDALNVEVVYACFNDLKAPPWCIMIDHRLKAFVISIRGTFSLSDVITDLSLGAQQLELGDEEEGKDEDDFHYVHTGVYAAAKHILEEMTAKNLFNYKPAAYKTVM